jgi:hypothetical protein
MTKRNEAKLIRKLNKLRATAVAAATEALELQELIDEIASSDGDDYADRCRTDDLHPLRLHDEIYRAMGYSYVDGSWITNGDDNLVLAPREKFVA